MGCTLYGECATPYGRPSVIVSEGVQGCAGVWGYTDFSERVCLAFSVVWIVCRVYNAI